uniref:PcfJ domain-containing protein n=1 Tax=Alistipes senegalensis TaxID=1288121 RepID=UPI001898B679
LLRYFNKDVLSARYVCPADLEAEHDRLERKKRERLKKEELHRKFRQAQEAEENFRELKSRFFGISFADDTICVRVLESVAEYVQEGELMHHCVYASAYYSRPDSLILTAQIGEEHIETVEVSLKTFQIYKVKVWNESKN